MTLDDFNRRIPTGKNAGRSYADKFNDFVSKGPDCWLWVGRVCRNGYGRFGIAGCRDVLAHRAAFALSGGGLSENEVVCHRCDVKLCVNPAHLWLGTQSDNIQDMLQKNRANPPRELRNHRCKLTAQDVALVREARKLGVSAHLLAERFEVRANHIWRIARGERR